MDSEHVIKISKVNSRIILDYCTLISSLVLRHKCCFISDLCFNYFCLGKVLNTWDVLECLLKLGNIEPMLLIGTKPRRILN